MEHGINHGRSSAWCPFPRIRGTPIAGMLFLQVWIITSTIYLLTPPPRLQRDRKVPRLCRWSNDELRSCPCTSIDAFIEASLLRVACSGRSLLQHRGFHFGVGVISEQVQQPSPQAAYLLASPSSPAAQSPLGPATITIQNPPLFTTPHKAPTGVSPSAWPSLIHPRARSFRSSPPLSWRIVGRKNRQRARVSFSRGIHRYYDSGIRSIPSVRPNTVLCTQKLLLSK